MTTASPQTSTSLKPRRRRLRRILVTLSIVLSVLLLVALLLPVWASTAQGRGYVLDQINRDLRGRLTVGSWSLGWFTGMDARNVTLADASGQPLFQCSQIKTQLTLLSILRGNFDFGETTITAPQLFLRAYSDGTSNINRLFTDPTANKTRANWQQMLSHLRGALKIENGTLVLTTDGTKEIILVQNIQGDIPIASPTSPVHLSVVGTCAHEQSRSPVSIEAGIPSLLAWSANPLIILQDIDIEAASLPVAPLAAWAGLSPDWDQSFGTTLDKFKLQNHQPRGSAWSVPTLEARGSRGTLSLSLLMETTPTQSNLSLPALPDYWARLSCAPSRPADALLAYANPFLSPFNGKIEVTLSELDASLTDLSSAHAVGILSVTNGRQVVSKQFRSLVAIPATLSDVNPGFSFSVPATRIIINAGRLSYDRMDLQFSPPNTTLPPLTFSGSINLTDSAITLFLTLPTDTPNTLSSGTLRLPITGTITTPIVTLPGGK